MKIDPTHPIGQRVETAGSGPGESARRGFAQ
jgi:hypothetical protein